MEAEVLHPTGAKGQSRNPNPADGGHRSSSWKLEAVILAGMVAVSNRVEEGIGI